MAKKKSKTQKYKKNIKKKAKRLQQATQKISLVNQEEKKIVKKQSEFEIELPKVKQEKEQKETKPKEIKNSSKKSYNFNFKDTLSKIKNKSKAKTKTKNNSIDLPKLKKDSKKSKRNVFHRLLFELKNNIHVIFNSMLIVIFIILLIGLIRINVFNASAILYMCCIIIFLMIVAISYNKYLSGKIFTIVLCIIMSFVIYKMQYTYDFIRNLNSNAYEYKTYYVVTFDNVSNRSIYSLNNKNIGLLKDNCINVERKLNTTLDKVEYIEYDDINILFYDFYNQKYRAILVNENQYKYLQNNIENNKKVKILYEFQANAKK